MQHINYCSHAVQLTFICHKGGRIMAQLFILFCHIPMLFLSVI
jgi:hypothetical protein